MGVYNYEWDAKTQKFVPEGTLIEERPESKPEHLSEIGTRYDHWTDLLEEFRSGVVALNTIKGQYFSKVDEVRRVQLSSAIELIEKQLERHSGFDRKKWDMGRQVDSIPRDPERIPRDK